MSSRFLIVIAATLAGFGITLAAEKPVQPATKPSTAPAAVQAKVVVNGEEVQIEGNGRMQMIVGGAQVVVQIDGGEGNAPAQIVRPGLLPVKPGKPEVPQRDALENVPAKLSAYTDLMKQCIAFENQTSTLQWKTIYEEDFAQKAKVAWSVVSFDNMNNPGVDVTEQEKAERVTLAKLKDRTVLSFDATGYGGGTLAVGPKVRGSFAIEYVAANLADAPSDLSILVGPVNQWVGFQFGGQGNNVCAVWGGPQIQPDGRERAMPQRIANNLRIEKDRFYTIRLEVVDGIIKGFIDRKLIGQGKVISPQFLRVDQQPQLYTWNSKIVIDSFKTEMMVHVQNVEPALVWDKVFPGRTRPQVQKQIEELVDMLADEDAAVRDAATAMLKRIGPLAIPPVKDATESGIAEQATRAQEILKSLQP